MTVDRDDAYAKTLTHSLERILTLQEFAEAKNAALLAFASVWIAGLVNLLASNRHPPPGFQVAAIVALSLFLIAAMTAITSLLPRFIRGGEGTDSAGPNMLFFGDIAHTPIADYVVEARKRYYPEEECFATETLFTDLSRQIAIVSRISMRKYRLFHRAAAIALAGIAVFAVPVVGLMVDAARQ